MGEETGQREAGTPVLAHYYRSDPLAHRGECIAVLEQSAIVVAVRVDEARRERQPLGIDDAITSGPRKLADRHDASIEYPHVGHSGGRAGAVEYLRVDDQRGLRLR